MGADKSYQISADSSIIAHAIQQVVCLPWMHDLMSKGQVTWFDEACGVLQPTSSSRKASAAAAAGVQKWTKCER